MIPKAPWPNLTAVPEQADAAFVRWLERLSRTDGQHVFIYRDYLYYAWLAGMTYADNQR